MVIAAIESRRGQLAPAEARVAAFVLARPHIVAEMTLAALAGGAGVSEPTVVRFCRAIGVGAFLEFRRALLRDMERRAPVRQGGLEQASQAIWRHGEDPIARAARVIFDQGGVRLFGPGARAAIATDFAARLAAQGLSVQAAQAGLAIGPGRAQARPGQIVLVVGACIEPCSGPVIVLVSPGGDRLEIAGALWRLSERLRSRVTDSPPWRPARTEGTL
jgi:DNA-binding MurR/RpiR family transcriptional regulator